MKLHLIRYVAKKIEPILTVLLLLGFFGINLNDGVEKLLKVTSYGIVGGLVVWRRKGFIYVITRDIFSLLLILLCCASILWSSAPEDTTIQIKAFARASVFGAYIAARYTINEQMQLWTWVFSILTLLSIPSNPGALGEKWAGIFSYKNFLAQAMVLGAILFLTSALRNGKKRWIALSLVWFSISVTIIFLSNSKSVLAILVMLLFVFPLFYLIKQNYKLQAIYIVLVLFLGSMLVNFVAENYETIIVNVLKKDLTLNGRTILWSLVTYKFLERPWLGYGYVGFWNSDEAHYVLNRLSWGGENGAFNAHNTYLDMATQIGGIGMILFLLGLIRAFKRSLLLFNYTQNKNDKIEIFWMLQTLITMVLIGVADSGSLLSANSKWSLYISILLSTAVKLARIKRLKMLTLNKQNITNIPNVPIQR